jgi:nitrogen fixation/metabolism regulation signal transduction histidine kinase
MLNLTERHQRHRTETEVGFDRLGDTLLCVSHTNAVHRAESLCYTGARGHCPVIDNGMGLEEKIFDAFMTTKEKGMGIGLAVSRSIVEAHGGRLWAENNPDGGATFNVALPVSSKRVVH